MVHGFPSLQSGGSQVMVEATQCFWAVADWSEPPASVKVALMVSLPAPFVSVYVNVTSPLLSVLQSTGEQTPTAPAFCPVTVNVTSWPTSGEPPLVTWAVIVWLVPAGLVASSGVTAMLPETTTIDDPAIRMYA